jgi:hypothetical protein
MADNNNEQPCDINGGDHEMHDDELEDHYEEGDVTRLEDLCLISKNDQTFIAVADHANGILIFDQGGQLKQHLNNDVDTLAFNVKYNIAHDELQSLVLDVPGWTLNIYKQTDASDQWSLTKQILLPTKPDVARMKLRWLTVTGQGDSFALAAGNVWVLRRSTWTWDLVHHDQRKQAWFSHLTPTDKGDQFIVCWKGDALRRATLNEDEGLVVDRQTVSPDDVKEMGAFAVDDHGYLLISDWATGDIILLNDEYKKLKGLGNVGEGEAYVMAAARGRVFIGCKQSLQVRAFAYDI